MTNQLGQINPTTTDQATKTLYLTRAAQEIEHRTGYKAQIKASCLLIDGVYVQLTDGDLFTTPFTLPFTVRDVIREINTF